MCRSFGQPAAETARSHWQARRKTDRRPCPCVADDSWSNRSDNLTGEAQLEYLGMGLADEFSTEITRYQEIRVLLMQHRERGQRRAEDTAARFVLNGSIQRAGSGLKVSVSLVDSSTGIQMWGDSYKTDVNPSELIGFQEEVANRIAGIISCEYGIIAKVVSQESKLHPPSTLKAYEAMLRYYEFNAHFSAETFFDAFEALKHASRKEPDCGLVWSMLARLCTPPITAWNCSTLKTSIGKGRRCLPRRGVALDPDNQRTRLIMAFVRLFQK
jgi:adenylate cyclase